MDTEKEQLFLRRKYGNLKEQSLTPWYMMQQQYQEQDVFDIYPDLLNIIAERDAAIEERNQAFLEKERAFQDRHVAIEQRNFAIRQRNDAVLERNNAFKSLQQSMLESIGQPPCKRLKRDDTAALDVLCKTMTSSACNESPHVNSVPRKRKVTRVPDSKDKINFDVTVMPVPGCSCTGVFRPCYKWGSGGWQSCCCTQTISAFPLPHVPNKRRSRKGGRKMTGSVFSKLLSRLVAEGYDFSLPVDLKDHWSKHGTNRYITIK